MQNGPPASAQYEIAPHGRKYRVEYLFDRGGKIARDRGRVALTLADLPPEWRKLPRTRRGGGNASYEHVYQRLLRETHGMHGTQDDAQCARREWFQPMFKKRVTTVAEDGTKVSRQAYYSKLGTYWDEGVAAVAAELALQRYEAGQSRQSIERVEQDVIDAARTYASTHQ